MPTVNIFHTTQEQSAQVNQLASELKTYLAKELTCGDIQLSSDEVSIRLISTVNAGMIAELEVEITAHSFSERVTKQDEVCNNVRKYLMDKIPVSDIRVWLLLPELGHSWE